MARHANGKNTYAVAGWVLALAALLVIALIAALFWGFNRGDGSDQAADQAAGTETATSQAEGAPSETSTTAQASQVPKESESPDSSAAAPASTGASDTLLLLDTSAGLEPNFDPVTQAAADTARGLGEKGKQVALWNYSSPLSPGVTHGYRTNLDFGPPADAASSVTQFGTGGVPQTRSAVVAAVASAAEHSAAINDSTRVVVVTTGTEDDMDDKEFADALSSARGDNVQLSVVHLGKNGQDDKLEAAADAFTTVDNPGDTKAVEKAFKEAAGI